MSIVWPPMALGVILLKIVPQNYYKVNNLTLHIPYKSVYYGQLLKTYVRRSVACHCENQWAEIASFMM